MMLEVERNVREWLEADPTTAAAEDFPKLFYNVNLPPVIVRDQDHEDALGEAWRPLNVGLIPDVPPVTIAPTSGTVPAIGGTGDFLVTMTGPGLSETWIAEKDASADWLTFTPDTPQSADGQVTYTAEPNLDVERTANIYVNGKTFAVTQDAGV